MGAVLRAAVICTLELVNKRLATSCNPYIVWTMPLGLKLTPSLAVQRLRASSYERWLEILETHGIGTSRYPLDILR